MISKNCMICGYTVAYEDQAKVNRVMGCHLSKIHGIRSKGYIPVKKRRAQVDKQDGLESPQDRKRRIDREYKRKLRLRKQLEHVNPVLPKESPPVAPKESSAEPCKLDTCCVCGARFYVLRGTS